MGHFSLAINSETAKGVRRGGKKATEKSVATRTRNKKAKQAEAEAKRPQPADPASRPIKSMTEIDDAAARLAAITNRIKKGDQNG